MKLVRRTPLPPLEDSTAYSFNQSEVIAIHTDRKGGLRQSDVNALRQAPVKWTQQKHHLGHRKRAHASRGRDSAGLV